MNKFESLSEFIAKEQAECLNEDSEHPIGNIFSSDPSRYLQSDVDAQLVLSVQFRVPVKLGAIRFSFREGIDEDSVPLAVKLFTNRVSLGFADAENIEPVQILSKKELSSGEQVPLRFVLFQNILSLQLFVENNGGADKTEIGEIEFFGVPGENMDMSQFKKTKEE